MSWKTNCAVPPTLPRVAARPSVGLMLIPQSLAHASIAGVDVASGLQTSCIPIVVFVALASSRHLSVRAALHHAHARAQSSASGALLVHRPTFPVNPIACGAKRIALGSSDYAVPGSRKQREVALCFLLIKGSVPPS